MIHYLDVRNINGAEIAPVDVVTFGSPCQDLSVAGKRAGLKHEDNGDDETTRSGLFMEAVRIIIEMRIATNGVYPTFAVWENVPGAFSSEKGEDFRIVLEELCKIADETVSIPRPQCGKWLNAGCIVGDGFSVAWRVMDAQFWGVPQRRRRIYLVVDFAGQRAGEILFEPCGVSRYTAPGKKERQGIAGDFKNCAGSTSINGYNGEVTRSIVYPDIARTLEARFDGSFCVDRGQNIVCYALQGNGIDRADTAGCNGKGWREDVGYTLNTIDRHAVCYGICSDASNSMKSDNPCSGVYEANTSRTLDLNGGNPACNQGGIAICQPIALEHHPMDNRIKIDKAAQFKSLTGRMGTGGNNVPLMMQTFGIGNGQADRVGGSVLMRMKSFGEYEEAVDAGALKARDYKDATDLVISSDAVAGIDCRNGVENGNLCGTLQAKPNGGYSLNCIHPVRIGYVVRRLTPAECARLQGFPDWWSELPQISEMSDEDYTFWDECLKINADINGKKYRKKSREQMIKWYNNLHTDSAEYKMWGNGVALPCALFVLRGIAECGAKTLGSLFDGSGGFPLAGVLNGIMPLWASEIEPYPVAVTKERFKGDVT